MAALAIDRMLDAGARPKDDATNAKDILGLNVQRFALGLTPDPALFSKENFGVGYGTDSHQKVQFAKGTTTLAFKFNGGVITRRFSIDDGPLHRVADGQEGDRDQPIFIRNDGRRRGGLRLLGAQFGDAVLHV